MKYEINIAEIIFKEEGFSSVAYPDPITNKEPYTFGHGLTYITESESRVIVHLRVEEIRKQLTKKFTWFTDLSNLRKIVIVNMCYQIGFDGFCNFTNTIKFISIKDFHSASIEMLDSLWYRQMHELDMKDGKDCENRAEWLAWIMKHDEYRERRV